MLSTTFSFNFLQEQKTYHLRLEKLRFVSHDAASWAQFEKILPEIFDYFADYETTLHRFF